MELLNSVFVILHFVGLASLLGGVLTQIKLLKPGTALVTPAMFHGSLTMLITGLALVGMKYALEDGDEVNNAKIAVKLVVLLVITALVLRNRKKDAVGSGTVAAIGGLTLLNVVLAVTW